MKYKITHSTHYDFEQPVTFNPHLLRLQPRENCFQKLHSFTLSISPEPAGRSQTLSTDGHIETLIWFDHPIQQLTINSISVVELFEGLTFNYVVYPYEYNQLPFYYSLSEYKVLAPYLEPLSNFIIPRQLTEDLALKCNQNTVAYVTALVDYVYKHFERNYRPLGEPFPPETTWAERKGSCRDLSSLQIAAYRKMGIASRFVSGYLYDDLAEVSELHSWAEIYLPGSGWRGFDTATGLALEHNHIAIAAGAEYKFTMPVEGDYFGDALSELKAEVDIEVV